jgi:hypothetical protein
VDDDGLEEAGRLFYLQLRAEFLTMGFKESKIYAATYTLNGKTQEDKLSKFDLNGTWCLVATWVDDIFMICPNETLRQKIMSFIKLTFKIANQKLKRHSVWRSYVTDPKGRYQYLVEQKSKRWEKSTISETFIM